MQRVPRCNLIYMMQTILTILTFYLHVRMAHGALNNVMKNFLLFSLLLIWVGGTSRWLFGCPLSRKAS